MEESALRQTSREIEGEYPSSTIQRTVEEQASNFGYDLEFRETDTGFVATTENGLEEALGTDEEALRVTYDENEGKLYIQGATRAGGTERSLADLVENHL